MLGYARVDDVEGLLEEHCSTDDCLACALDKQQSADEEAEDWAEIWQEGVLGNEARWPQCLGDHLPQIPLQEFRDACNSFPSQVGLGWDKLHPKALARCSDIVFELFISVLLSAELMGQWPSCIGVILVVLLPKADGGRRPIGLFPSLIRIWMRVRLKVAQQ